MKAGENGVRETLPVRLIDRLRSAPAEQRAGILMASLREQMAMRLQLEVRDIEPRGPLMALGMTSLQAMEVKTHLERELDMRARTSLLFDYPTLAALVPYILEQLGLSPDTEDLATPPHERTRSHSASADGPVGASVVDALTAELADLRRQGAS